MNGFHNPSRSLSGLLLACAVLFHVSYLPAQVPSTGSEQAITIAVMDFDGFGISQVEAIALTNRLRNELFRLGTYQVVDRGMMENILQEQNFQMTGCTSNECLVEVGQLLGARQMVGGSISKIGAMFTVSARVVDVVTGKLLSVSDFDIRGGLEEMLTTGMMQVALALSGDDTAARALAAQQTFQSGQPVAGPTGTAAQRDQPEPLPPTITKPRRWQSRFGAGFNGDEFATLPFSYDLQGKLKLGGIQFQPVISGGVLSRWYYDDYDYEDYGESSFYGMIELHRKWSSIGGNVGASLYTGIGLNRYYFWYEDGEGDDYDGISLIFTGGIQMQARLLPILPTLVGDFSIVATPEYGASTIYSIGGQGSFLQLASVWGSIFFLIYMMEGGF